MTNCWRIYTNSDTKDKTQWVNFILRFLRFAAHVLTYFSHTPMCLLFTSTYPITTRSTALAVVDVVGACSMCLGSASGVCDVFSCVAYVI